MENVLSHLRVLLALWPSMRNLQTPQQNHYTTIPRLALSPSSQNFLMERITMGLQLLLPLALSSLTTFLVTAIVQTKTSTMTAQETIHHRAPKFPITNPKQDRQTTLTTQVSCSTQLLLYRSPILRLHCNNIANRYQLIASTTVDLTRRKCFPEWTPCSAAIGSYLPAIDVEDFTWIA